MGLLTNPSLNQRNKFGQILIKHNRKICLILYLAGLVWFVCLGHPDVNHSTYMSENALSPGLVYSELKQDSARLAQIFLDELKKERENHITNMPYSWVHTKMEQIGLETYIHNFTLNYPFGGGKVFQGKNVYGILRAPRSASTEGILFSAPYRPPNSVHADITPSIPLLLAFAEFARKKNYWAKDLIFLITEQEQLGVHAWLQAYYHGEYGQLDNVLKSGNLQARAGALQAALNLEIEDFNAEHIDIKIEGLNGQLPNLDMFNLVQRLAVREGISSGYKQIGKKKRKSNHLIKENLKHILSMIISQANGVPTGNHGLFHRHRIESLTLEAGKRLTGSLNNKNVATVTLLKTIEGISRSLNNLLERFHQSYFFYILVQNERFISIGDFIPCLALMAGPLFIKAFLLWLNLSSKEGSVEMKEKHEINIQQKLPYIKVLVFMVGVGALGAFANTLPLCKAFSNYFAEHGITTQISISIMICLITMIGFFAPTFLRLNNDGLELLHIAALLCLGCALFVIGLLNFALGILIAFVSCPLAILMDINRRNYSRSLVIICTLLLNPLVTIYLVVLALTLSSFSELTLSAACLKALNASIDAITYGLVDYMIYGNWLYSAVARIFFPIWVLFWSLNFIRTDIKTLQPKKIKMM